MMFCLWAFTSQNDICLHTLSWDLGIHPNGTITQPIRVFRKPDVLLAEFEQDLFKHKHWSSASQDSESLSRKQGVGDPGHGGSEQGLDCTLRGKKHH